MSRKSILLYCLCFFLLSLVTDIHAQQVFKTTPTSVIGFLEYLPDGYNNNTNKYPIVIFLHGLGERGPNGTDPAVLATGVPLLLRNGPPHHVNRGTDFPFILISPQLKSSYGDWPTDYVLEVLNYVKTYLRIDESRIYLTGLSLGGGGTWNTAQDHPNLFAAIAPVCGSRNKPSMACSLAAQNLPVWAFHGDRDGTVPLSRSVNMVNAINNCVPAPNPKAILTIYEGVAHNSWVNAYMPDHSVHNPNIYEWMLSKRKGAATTNKIPVANAGTDKTITLPVNSLTVTGSGTDSDGTIASYLWTKVSGGAATLAGVATTSLKVSGMVAGTYVFRLTVKDDKGASDTDDVTVIVKPANDKPENVAPVANAGTDKAIALPTNSLTLTGTGTDSDGTIASYAWTKVSGGEATLSGAATTSLKLTGLMAGTYVFRLTVADNEAAQSHDDVTVTVTSGNLPPVVDAGADKTLLLPTNYINITGTASDTDGKITSYWWDKVSGGTCATASITSPTLKVTKMVEGTYVFRLTVVDDDGAKSFDEVKVTVTSGNLPPVVNVGADKTLTLPTNYINITGTASDTDGKVVSYWWDKVSGGACSAASITSPTIKLTKLLEGTYVFRLTVTDDDGAKSFDEVKIVVSSTGTTARIAEASMALTETEETDAALAPEEETQPLADETTAIDLIDGEPELLKDCIVAVFNEQGERIYKGEWYTDTYHEVFSGHGLYFFHVMKEGNKIKSGKIYIRD